MLVSDARKIKYILTQPHYLGHHGLLDGFEPNIIEETCGMIVSTITCSGSFNVSINLEKLMRFVPLNINNVLSIKYNGIYRCMQHLLTRKRIKPNNKHFENQITMVVNVENKRNINVKLFSNGSFQMTGCKSIKDCNIMLNKLKVLLETNFYVCENNAMVNIGRIADSDDELKVIRFSKDMINVVFNLGFQINRHALYKVMMDKKEKATFDKGRHPAVIVKLPNGPITPKKQKFITLIIFESGKIMITGNKNNTTILASYNFINSIIRQHKKEITQIPKPLNDAEIRDIEENIEMSSLENTDDDIDDI